MIEEDEELKVGDSEGSGGVKTTPMGDIPDAIVFICDTFTDFLSWRKALDSYVVQHCKVDSVYHLGEQIGKGSHA